MSSCIHSLYLHQQHIMLGLIIKLPVSQRHFVHVATLQQRRGRRKVPSRFCSNKRIKNINRIIQNATYSQIMC